MVAARGAFSLDVKAAILARDGGRCDRCGFRVTSGHFHHRHPREMGGTRKLWVGLPSNGLLLHPACHDWVEEHRNVSRELGMLVQSGHRPAQIPVYRWNGWHLLFDDGSMQKTTAPSVPTGSEVGGGVDTGAALDDDLGGPATDPVPIRPVVDGGSPDPAFVSEDIGFDL